MCSVPGCENRKTETDSLLMHRIPKKLKLRKQWIHKCRLAKVSKGTLICSAHFVASDYKSGKSRTCNQL